MFMWIGRLVILVLFVASVWFGYQWLIAQPDGNAIVEALRPSAPLIATIVIGGGVVCGLRVAARD